MNLIVRFVVAVLLAVCFLVPSSFAAGSQTLPNNDGKLELIQHAVEMEIKYELPSGLLVSICEQESRWRNVAGQAGEIGVCQIKPSTIAHICPKCAEKVTHENYRLGSKGDVVSRLQAVLAKDGFYTKAIDGIFGPATYKAVQEYQSAMEITADGVVGIKTWTVMFAGEPFPGKNIVDSLWNPRENIEWAAKYLDWLQANYSTKPLLLMAMYNGGPGNPVVRYMMSVEQRLNNVRM